MTHSLGTYPDLFDRGARALQSAVSRLGIVADVTEVGPVGKCAVSFAGLGLAVIERRDGWHHTEYGPGQRGWHREGTYEELLPWVLLWASTHPTELRQVGGKRLKTPGANELVAIDNRLVEHQTPELPRQALERRQFVSIRLTGIELGEAELAALRAAL